MGITPARVVRPANAADSIVTVSRTPTRRGKHNRRENASFRLTDWQLTKRPSLPCDNHRLRPKTLPSGTAEATEPFRLEPDSKRPYRSNRQHSSSPEPPLTPAHYLSSHSVGAMMASIDGCPSSQAPIAYLRVHLLYVIAKRSRRDLVPAGCAAPGPLSIPSDARSANTLANSCTSTPLTSCPRAVRGPHPLPLNHHVILCPLKESTVNRRAIAALTSLTWSSRSATVGTVREPASLHPSPCP